MESHHGIKCDLCGYWTEGEDNMDTHSLFNHNFPCPNCLNIFRTLDKQDGHIKLEITNPTHKTLYTKHWLIGMDVMQSSVANLINRWLFCTVRTVVSNKKPCGWTPYSLSSNSNNQVMYLESGQAIQ